MRCAALFLSIEAISSKRLLEYVYLNAVAEEGLRIYLPAGAAYLSRIIPKGGCEISDALSQKAYVWPYAFLFYSYSFPVLLQPR